MTCPSGYNSFAKTPKDDGSIDVDIADTSPTGVSCYFTVRALYEDPYSGKSYDIGTRTFIKPVGNNCVAHTVLSFDPLI